MKSRIVTAIPVYNGEKFIAQTLESVARQTLRPDRVVVLDNCSTDRTEEIVRGFSSIRCEFIRNPANLGLFQNFNRCLEFAPETEFLQILHADDTLEPAFYETMTRTLAGVEGRGLAWCLDRRIDEEDRHLSLSGKTDGKIERLDRDTFLKRKAEIGNQAFCATLLKTNFQPTPCQFPLDYPILGDMIFWAAFGAHCENILHVRLPLACYRWHGANETVFRAPTIQSLILDEWRTMKTNEELRGKGWIWHRSSKLKGLLAVRSGIKAKRVRQNGDAAYSCEIIQAARGITGWPLWLAGMALVELRDFYLFKILRRPRHPKNIYS
ncbi:MAG TPA: glycosyltransferase family 2 protein [Verrucomicrobiae bacterium]|nr:glycosyltransferase family 2 protein [Verrucomicrobiae bacterium]